MKNDHFLNLVKRLKLCFGMDLGCFGVILDGLKRFLIFLPILTQNGPKTSKLVVLCFFVILVILSVFWAFFGVFDYF